MNYVTRVPRNAKEVAQFDKKNGNLLWTNAILKELEALMSMKLFKKLLPSLCKAMNKGFRFAPLRIILMLRYILEERLG